MAREDPAAAAGPLVRFCARLKRLQEAAGLTQTSLAVAADRSTSQMSAILNGQIKKRPEWDVVRKVVDACLAHAEETGRLVPPDLRDEEDWRRRYFDLEQDLEGGRLASHQRDDNDTRLIGRRIEDKVDRRIDEVLDVLERLKYAIASTAPTAVRTLPADIISFTGRQADMAHLMDVLTRSAHTGGVVRINAIDGMAGVGKTAFAVHAAHELAARFPDGQLFIRLHGHTSDHQPVDPVDALATLLLATGVAPQLIPTGMDERAAMWRDSMAGRRVLLVFDDATGDEQVRPLLPAAAGTLVLVTSRRRLTGLSEAVPLTLNVLQADDAAQLFTRLVDRPDLRPTDTAVADLAESCGYLPLAISLVAGQLKHHPSWTATDLATDLASAADRLDSMAAGTASVAAAFDLSYHHIPDEEQRLFRQLGLHPGTDIDVYGAAALNDADLSLVRRFLDNLYSYHLIEEPARGRYRFHDLVREHARIHAAADDQEENDSALDRLLTYYLQTARAADRYLARRMPIELSTGTSTSPRYLPELTTRQDATAWMDAERLNLHAAVNYAALHGLPDYACAIAGAMHSYLRNQGYWHQALDLHRIALNAARQASNRLAQASALTDLGVIEYLTGDYSNAANSLSLAVQLSESIHDRLAEGNALTDLGVVRNLTGDNAAAITNLSRALELHRSLGNRLGEATAVSQLGTVQYITGAYAPAIINLSRALELHRSLGNRLGEANALNNLGVAQHLTGIYAEAVINLSSASSLHRELGNRMGQANALTELGNVHRLNGQHDAATASEEQALGIYRELGSRLGEGTALNNLGIIQFMQGSYKAAADNLTLALEIHRDLGNRTGEAEALNHLGELRLATATPAEAYACHERARIIAIDIGSPIEHARALEGIGKCYLEDVETDKWTEPLRQALTIYRQIGSPNAKRVEKTIDDHGG
jgi:tetratricopeptide (TPR) repeat protein/transcriptional regulator with XRE-family HTH domain